MYSLTTQNITISVTPTYQPEFSSPEDGNYVWSYEIVMQNNSKRPVQFLRRHWVIIDANGFVTQVTGEGVIGHQPSLEPKQAFQYVSKVQVHTQSGVMCGKYIILWLDTHEETEVEVPAFSLDFPGQKTLPN